MAFGGIFNPNYAMLPNQQGQNSQMPQQRYDPTQMGYGNSNPMALYSLYGLLGTGNQKGGLSATTTTAPQVPTVPPSSGSSVVPGTPLPTQPPAPGGTPVDKPGGSMPPPPSVGSSTMPGTYAPQIGAPPPGGTPVPKPSGSISTPPPPPAPNPGNDPAYPLPGIDSYAGTPYQQALSQYNSPEYAAYYNSLAPSTRAYMTPPGSQQMGEYLAQQWQDNYDAFQGNPWTR
jgi:hypothetical protein